MLKDFTSKYFLEVKAVAIRTKLPFNDYPYIAEFISWAYHHLPIKVLKQKYNLEKFIPNAEAYLDPCKISTMELFGTTELFSPICSIIEFRLGSKYASVMEEDILRFFGEKSPQVHSITIIEWPKKYPSILKDLDNFPLVYFIRPPYNLAKKSKRTKKGKGSWRSNNRLFTCSK